MVVPRSRYHILTDGKCTILFPPGNKTLKLLQTGSLNVVMLFDSYHVKLKNQSAACDGDLGITRGNKVGESE